MGGAYKFGPKWANWDQHDGKYLPTFLDADGIYKCVSNYWWYSFANKLPKKKTGLKPVRGQRETDMTITGKY